VNIIQDGKLPMAQYKFEAVINEVFNNPAQNVYYGPAVSSNVRIGYIVIRNEDPNVGHSWNVTARLTLDGNVLTSAVTLLGESTDYYLYLPSKSDVPVLTTTITPIGVAFPCDSATFQVEAKQATEALGHGPLRILVRWWRL